MSQVIPDEHYTIVRVENFLLSYGINNSELFNDDEIDVNREPLALEYKALKDATDKYMKEYIMNCEVKEDNVTFVKYESKINNKTYQKDNIPNGKFQVCVRYSYADIYYTKTSNLTDEMKFSAECILTRALPCTKYIEYVRKIDNGETMFKATESVFFKTLKESEINDD